MPTLDELLDIPTQSEVMDQEVIPELRSRAVRVTDWLAGSVYRAMAWVVALMRVSSRRMIGAIAAAGFESYAFGLTDQPAGIDVTDWADLVAENRYGLERIAATFTLRDITLTNATATPYSVIPGDIILQFTATGNRYILNETSTIAGSTDTVLSFRSEFATDSASSVVYSDASDADIVLVTSDFPGVTASNPAPDYSDVAQSGSGVGTVTPSGTPDGPHTVAVRIDTTGNEGDSSVGWSTSLDGDSWEEQTGDSVTDLGSTGIDITIDDNGGDPAFVVGAVYYFSSPGSDITQVGRDEETPPELGARCQALIPTFAATLDGSGNYVLASPTQSAYELLARTASTQVKVCLVETDDTVNNTVNIYIAGQGALLDGATIAAVQNYMDHFTMITDRPVVQSVTGTVIELGGPTIIVVKKGQKAAAQSAMQLALAAYFGGVDAANPLTVNDLIEHAYIIKLMRGITGVKRITDGDDMTINAVSEDLQLPVSADHEIALWEQTIATVFTWREE